MKWNLKCNRKNHYFDPLETDFVIFKTIVICSSSTTTSSSAIITSNEKTLL